MFLRVKEALFLYSLTGFTKRQFEYVLKGAIEYEITYRIHCLIQQNHVFEIDIDTLTFRRLGDEMRSMSLEKTRQREVELAQEIDRLQMEIKTLQKNSEEAANVNQQLSKEVGTFFRQTHFGFTTT